MLQNVLLTVKPRKKNWLLLGMLLVLLVLLLVLLLGMLVLLLGMLGMLLVLLLGMLLVLLKKKSFVKCLETSMTDQERKAMEMAVVALEYHQEQTRPIHKTQETVAALRQALAQDEQEPVREHDKVDLRCECCGYMTYHREHLGCIRAAAPPSNPEQGCGECGVKASDGYALYCVKCVLPMKEWIGLTDDEVKMFDARLSGSGVAREIEAKLKEKNT